MNALNFIGGVFVEAHDGETLTNINPATGEEIGRIARSNKADVEAAVQASRLAQNEWSALTLLERADWLDRLADGLEQRKEELAQRESKDTGKPLALARRVDAQRSIDNFRFFANFAREQEPEVFEMADATNVVHRKPIGTVGLITPWNLPLYLLSWKVAPALLMGNTIVAKPSEMTPLTANLLCEVASDIGLPSGVLNVVHGYGPEVGQAILEHPSIRAISFTGGTATGRHVAATAAPKFKKLSLELGGKNATIILDDANLDAAVEGAVRAGFTNGGQVCLCGSRILVHQSIADQFTTKLVESVNSMMCGAPEDASTHIGALISMEHLQKVESYIELGLEEGGTVLTGGTRAMTGQVGPTQDGAYLRPTIIDGLDPSARTSTEEIFGPVVTLHRFDSDEQAIQIANATEYGLAGSIWSTDTERAHALAQKIETGIVWVNTWLHRDLRTPFGGVKNSGVGREGGAWSLGFFSEPLNVCIKHD
ncbi:MAG: 2-hydroxymuconic semialdehyde dehydrogenase [Euryarchaeota archaeon]|nr:2-hydroxymuconic semialdehyde dehydrogenase [Euryarchaeota archaeon]|tara:strand:+ start:13847 stop:15292 length:1446 start_codon:yes stop_codon:yes gene_type:complete